MAGTFTLTGTFKQNDGVTPLVDATIQINAGPFPDPTDNVVYGQGLSTITDANGHFSVNLVTETSLFYSIYSPDGLFSPNPFTFAAPANGTTVDVTDLTVFDPAGFTPSIIATVLAAVASVAYSTWQATTAYVSGQTVQAPDGSLIKANSSRTSRASFDATEQTFWTVVFSKSGTLEQVALSNKTWYSVTDYGATGNGTTDDTTAITNAVAAVPAGGGVLYFPPGTYKVTSTIDLALRTNIKLVGAGCGENNTVGGGTSVIVFSGTGYAITWAVSAVTALFAGIVIEGLHIRGSGTSPTGGIYLGNGSNAKIIDCVVSDFKNVAVTSIGIRVGTATSAGSQYCELRGTTISLCDQPLFVDNSNGLRVIGGLIEGTMPTPVAGTTGVKTTTGCDTLTMVGVVVQGYATLFDISGSNCSFIGVRCEAFITQAYRLNGNMSHVLGGSINNFINSSVGTGIIITASGFGTVVDIIAVQSVATKLTDSGTNTVARFGYDADAITPGRTTLTHTNQARVNKVGAGAQDPSLTMESNATVGPTIKTDGSFARMVINHAYASATGISLQVVGTEALAIGAGNKLGFFGGTAVVKGAALTAAPSAAPAGGTGTAAGGWDTSAHRDSAITTINTTLTRLNDLVSRLQAYGLIP